MNEYATNIDRRHCSRDYCSVVILCGLDGPEKKCGNVSQQTEEEEKGDIYERLE